jgi:hypothetical protein
MPRQFFATETKIFLSVFKKLFKKIIENQISIVHNSHLEEKGAEWEPCSSREFFQVFVPKKTSRRKVDSYLLGHVW